MNNLIKVATRFVVRGDDQRFLRSLDESLRHRSYTFLTVGYLMDAALLLQVCQSFSNFAACEVIHCMFECRISLSHDFIQMSSPHPSFLELLERPPCFNPLVLAYVTYQQYSVIFFQAMQEFMHLLCAGETRFVEHVQMSFPFLRLLAANKVPLQRARFNPCFSEILRCAGSRREAAHLVAFSLCGFPDRGQRSCFAGSSDPVKRGNLVATR